MTTTQHPDTSERQRVLDAYARRGDDGRYDPSRPDQIALAAARADVWRDRIAAHRLATNREPGTGLGTVLEIGCGTGAVARWALHQGATRVVGVDLQPERLVTARAQLPVPGYVVGDARALPARDGSVDIAICSTLFSSVLDETVAGEIAAEVDRVVAPDGMVLWFDFFRRNPRNPDVRAVGATELERWFPGWDHSLRRVVLAPPLARRLARFPRVADALSIVPLLRTHYAGALTRR